MEPWKATTENSMQLKQQRKARYLCSFQRAGGTHNSQRSSISSFQIPGRSMSDVAANSWTTIKSQLFRANTSTQKLTMPAFSPPFLLASLHFSYLILVSWSFSVSVFPPASFCYFSASSNICFPLRLLLTPQNSLFSNCASLPSPILRFFPPVYPSLFPPSLHFCFSRALST